MTRADAITKLLRHLGPMDESEILRTMGGDRAEAQAAIRHLADSRAITWRNGPESHRCARVAGRRVFMARPQEVA